MKMNAYVKVKNKTFRSHRWGGKVMMKWKNHDKMQACKQRKNAENVAHWYVIKMCKQKKIQIKRYIMLYKKEIKHPGEKNSQNEVTNRKFKRR